MTFEVCDQIAWGKEFIAHAMNYYDGIEDLEIGRWVESPPEMTERTNVPNGNVYHVDMTLGRMGPLRPALGFGGYRMPVPGLYLSGAGAHPGPSVSGLPGQQATRTLLRDLAKSHETPTQRRRLRARRS